jgi:hypothetical protein
VTSAANLSQTILATSYAPMLVGVCTRAGDGLILPIFAICRQHIAGGLRLCIEPIKWLPQSNPEANMQGLQGEVVPLRCQYERFVNC